MSKVCDGCGQALPPGTITAGEIETAVRAASLSWTTLQGKTLTLRGAKLPVEVVALSVPEGRIFDYEGPQGVEYELSVVFSLNGQFYRKTGTADSYGTQAWDGLLKLVRPTTKTITVFE